MKKKITIGICLLMVAVGTYFLKVQRTPDITSPNTPADLPALAVQSSICQLNYWCILLSDILLIKMAPFPQRI